MKAGHVKTVCFWLLAFVPLVAFLELASWVIVTNGVPSRIRARLGRGTMEFHVSHGRRAGLKQPLIISNPGGNPSLDTGRQTNMAMFHPDLGWDYPPGVVYKDIDGVVYSHDSDGARRTCTSFENTCIATYGDSFTYCTDVPDEHTWQTFLAQELQCNVKNFGVAGYGTDQAFLKYQLHANVRTNMVMLCIWPENINRVVNIYRPFLHHDERLGLTKPRFVRNAHGFALIPNPARSVSELEKLKDPAFLAELGELDYWYQFDQRLPSISVPYLITLFRWREPILRQFGISLTRFFPSVVEASYPWNLYDEQEPLAIMCHIVDEFVKTAVDRESQPLIVILPHKDQIRELSDYRINRVRRLLDYLNAKRYPFLDVVQVMADMNPTEEELNRWYIGHMSPEGNRLVAEIISRELRRGFADVLPSVQPQPAKAGPPKHVAESFVKVRSARSTY